MSYEKSGKIAAEALLFGKKLIKEGEKLLEISKKVEEKIKELNGELAFPTQVSINEVAAHYCPDINDETVIKQGDLVKLDIGVHVDGYIGDTALSVDVGSDKHLELIRASKDALRVAIENMKPEIELREVGKAIEEVIVGYGFHPIKNLSGHEIKNYELHAGSVVPNYDNGDKTKLKEGQVFAVEPFATTGEGFVKDGKLSGIYHIVLPRNVRSGREVLGYAMDKYQTLPFARKWLIGKFSEFKTNFSLRILEREAVIQQYHQLVERTNGLVSQAEHTVKVADKPVILTQPK